MVNNDSGVYGKELVQELSKDFNIKVYQKDEVMEKLKKKTIAEFYEIDQDFSQVLMDGQKPQVRVNRREPSNEFNDFEMKVGDLVNKLMFSSIVEEKSGEKIALSSLINDQVSIIVSTAKKTGVGRQVVISLLISFNLFCSIGMCYELAALKKERTLRRSLTTGNKPKIIIGAILGAQFIIIVIGYVALLLIYIFLNDKTLLSQALIIILNLMMTTAVALSLAVFVSRIVKDEKLIGVVMQIILVGTCFIGGSFVPVEILPKGISIFSRVTPQYWALQSIKDGRPDYSIIVLLFAVVLFTAGTVSTRSFAE
jgi:ABC-2 type transport system permease protein